MSVESEGPPAPPVLGRKVSTYSETDSGVDVDNDTEEAGEVGLEKRIIKPDLDIISKLCNLSFSDCEAVSIVNCKSLLFWGTAQDAEGSG